MINERIIAEKFSVIWKQHFPLLTPNYMRVFNVAQTVTVNKRIIPSNSNMRYDLISEFSFNLSNVLSNSTLNFDDAFKNKEMIINIVSNTAKEIWKSGNYSSSDLELTKDEIVESKRICNNMLEFISKMKGTEFNFKPKLRGYGIIPDLVADLEIDDTLFEIKTVNRNFRSSDLRQLFLYLALQQVTGNMKWKYGGLYNPRKGIYCKFNVKSLIHSISGGRSTNEVFENLLNSFTRDIEIDTKF